jgi:hypothetical protein
MEGLTPVLSFENCPKKGIHIKMGSHENGVKSLPSTTNLFYG